MDKFPTEPIFYFLIITIILLLTFTYHILKYIFSEWKGTVISNKEIDSFKDFLICYLIGYPILSAQLQLPWDLWGKIHVIEYIKDDDIKKKLYTRIAPLAALKPGEIMIKKRGFLPPNTLKN